MASSTNCFDLQVGSSDDVDLLKPKQKVKQNLVEECEQMWEHIQDVRQSFVLISYLRPSL